ncbi:DUF802 domain-containing protein [Achromobacter insolitus]|uniref:DUF802 domain-containing protein n=1 Tax=Achromobacter insolitus TaxID=217204 RepID=A0A6S7F1D6_9BURK|nr:DUF802 domain-containing protein [Achromobacter insolitus]CAB3929913.1 hypothetical protein LMG6000_00966 [Achromobacter insolitus]CAB3934968.1 hypothetical protein LMG5997_01980 [Achromobacter insolitus]
MSKYLTNLVVFLAGLAVVGWIGMGYAGSNPLALAVTLLIAVCYLTGALELLRYQQATSALTRALSDLTDAPGNLGSWLDKLPPALRNATRLRIEGERAGLPGPALTPYLVGLLVLLGMLGTFLGMVVTLRGTGLALESATDLAAIRASLAAPVKGLGFAFGTSIAGVASSAMLGLLAALCRRERVRAAQLLDSKAATTLRVYSQGYQREESFKLLQRQAEVMQRQAESMPTLVEQLQTMMNGMAQQNQALSDRHMASQDAFQSKAEAAYSRLAAVMEQSMKETVAQSARSAGAALQPVVEATMAGLSRETASLQDTVAEAVQRQLEGLTANLQATTSNVADIWNQALAGQQRASEAMSQNLRASLEQFAQTFEQRSAALLDSVSSRLEESSGSMSQAWTQALSRQEQASEKLAGDNLQALTAAAASFEQHSASLLRTLNQSHTLLQSELASRDQQRLAAWTETLGAMGATLRQEWEQSGAQAAQRQEVISATLAQAVRDITAQAEVQAQLLEGVSARMEAAANGVSQQWASALARQEQAGEKLADDNRQALAAAAATFEQHSAALLQTLDQSHAQLQAALASRDQERLAAWTGTLTAMATTLGQQWQQAGADTVARQQAVSDTLAQTARDITAQTQAQAGLLENVSARLEAAAGSVTQSWTEAQTRQEHLNAKLAGDNQQALETAAAAFEQHAATLLQTLNQSHAELQAALASRDQERLAAWTGTLTAMAAKLGQEWEQAGTQAALRQLEVNDTLAQTARDITAQTKAQADLLENASARLETAAHGVTQAWTDAQARQEQANAKLAGDNQQALEAAAAAFEQHSAALLQTLEQSHAGLQDTLASRDQERLAAWTGTLTAMAAKLGQEWEQAGTQAALRQLEVNDTLAQTARDITAQTQAQADQLESASARLETAANGVTQAWTEAQARQEQVNAKLAGDNQQALEAAAAAFEQHSAALLQTLEQSHADLQTALAAKDEARLDAWTGKLGTIADTLRTEWEHTSEYTANQQQQICDTLAVTAQDISAQAQASANDTIAEIGRLVQAASEAPRAAAEVIGELRQKLSDSMERDNDMLEERNRLLETLGTLLEAVNHTAAEQRTAVDALVSSSADLLDRVGTQFTDQVQAETGRLAEVAAQVASGAVEVASLGESFGAAVQLFGESNDKLVAHLQRIEAALDKSIARGDEQLAYYVAQAREVVDLSMVSQKQIIENLQQLASQRATAGAETA